MTIGRVIINDPHDPISPESRNGSDCKQWGVGELGVARVRRAPAALPSAARSSSVGQTSFPNDRPVWPPADPNLQLRIRRIGAISAYMTRFVGGITVSTSRSEAPDLLQCATPSSFRGVSGTTYTRSDVGTTAFLWHTSGIAVDSSTCSRALYAVSLGSIDQPISLSTNRSSAMSLPVNLVATFAKTARLEAVPLGLRCFPTQIVSVPVLVLLWYMPSPLSSALRPDRGSAAAVASPPPQMTMFFPLSPNLTVWADIS